MNNQEGSPVYARPGQEVSLWNELSSDRETEDRSSRAAAQLSQNALSDSRSALAANDRLGTGTDRAERSICACFQHRVTGVRGQVVRETWVQL
jgi:hypothetical protein